MTGWSIKGESGKALDATERALSSLPADTASLTLSVLESDVFEWSAVTADAAGTGVIIPDAGQLVEVFHDGTRRFRGHVTIPRVTTKALKVRAEGPWWWLRQIMLSSSQQDGTGSSADRASYVFPTQALSTSITALLTRAALLSRSDAGDASTAKFAVGSIDTIFSFPRITLAEQSFAQALAELLSIGPDAVAWFDYSGTGLPVLNVTRRGNMSSQTYAIGTAAVEEIDLSPRLDLQVGHVAVQSVSRRTTDGKTQWVLDEAGTAAPGKNQIVVVSGPEVNDILPKDSYDSFQCQTIALPTDGVAVGTLSTASSHTATSITSALKTFVFENDETIATIIREFFGGSAPSELALSNGGRFLVSGYPTGNLNGAPSFFFDRPNLISKEDPSGLYIVISADRVPEWAKTENGLTVIDATLTSFVRYTLNHSQTAPDWWDEVVRRGVWSCVGYPANTGDTVGYYQRNIAFQSSIPVQLISASHGTLATIYRQWDYDYLSPPDGLAADLLAAQNWIPWQGFIVSVADDVDGASGLNLKTNVTGTLTDCATMAALSKSVIYEIMRGRKTLNLGAPARTDYGTLANRFRRHPKDNIVYL